MTVVNPLTDVVYPAGTQIPIAQVNPFAAYALSNLPPTNAGAASSRSNNDEALLLIRDYSDKYDAKVDDQINDRMSPFCASASAKTSVLSAGSFRTLRRRRQRLHSHASSRTPRSAIPGRVTPSSIFEVRFGFTHVLAGKQPPYLGGPSLRIAVRLSGPPDCVESYRRPEYAEHQRLLHVAGPPDQQSAIPESHFVRSEAEFLESIRPPLSEDGL